MARRRKRSIGWLYWLVMLILLIGAVVVVYLVWDNYFNDKKNNDYDDGVVQVDDDTKIEKDEEKEDDAQTSEPIEKQKTEQYDGDDPNNAMELSGAITYAQVVGDKLMVRINIDQFLEDGNCELRVSRGENTIHSSVARIISNASTATCEGFDIATDGLGTGKVELEVKLNSGGKNGIINGWVDL